MAARNGQGQIPVPLIRDAASALRECREIQTPNPLILRLAEVNDDCGRRDPKLCPGVPPPAGRQGKAAAVTSESASELSGVSKPSPKPVFSAQPEWDFSGPAYRGE